MINSLEYTKGNLHIKIDGHRHVLESAKTIDGEEIPESDISNELPLIQAVAAAVFPLGTRSNGVARFDERTGLVKWNGRVITPESRLTGLPQDIKAFVMAVRTQETIDTFNSLKPPEYEMERVKVESIEIRNGVPTLVKGSRLKKKTKKVKVMNEDGSPSNLWYHEPIKKPQREI